MFASAEQPHVVDKATFKAEAPELRANLLQAQLELVEARKFPVLVVVSGIDGAGKGRAIHRLYEWLDPRHVRTHAYADPTDEERLRPRMWRFWRDLPPTGEIGVVFGSWYTEPLRERSMGRIDDAEFNRKLESINRFELMLANEGALILKFWFHLSREQQKQRLKKIKQSTGLRRHVLEEWSGLERHDQAIFAGEAMARITSTGHAPWIVVPSYDHRYRDLAMGKTILAAIRRRLDEPFVAPSAPAPALVATIDRRTALDALDLENCGEPKNYTKRLDELQGRLADLTEDPSFEKIALVAVFEGNDAAGKGGAIRRVAMALDPRRYRVRPIAAPSDEERARPYLWRFWRRIPRKGQITIFDRSWYGRVLVERIEGYCTEAEWMRAYNEIIHFEEQLTRYGVVMVKFWLAISNDEQLRRFKEREEVSFKQHKITEEDWRNREKWEAYRLAVGDMVDRTSTRTAPWTLVAAENKRHARVMVLETLCNRLEAARANGAGNASKGAKR